ncbi:MAG: GDYXXLXY domain-containing protein [Rubrivivax sp.]|nr:GDYXXLXY domain-containing protein [Rubrivivax sp.]
MNATSPVAGALRAVVAQGLLPAGTEPPAADPRPWPVLLLMALGAWLAALPLLGVLGLLFGDLLRGDAGPYLAGGLVLAAALVVLRSREVPLFVEQLAVPALLVGLLGLGVGLFRDFSPRGGALAMCTLVLGSGALLPKAWLRVPLGAAAAALLALALTGPGDVLLGSGRNLVRLGLAWQGAAAAALGALALVAAGRAGPPRWAAAADALGAGALLGTLAGLAWWSGMSFLVGGATGAGAVGEIGRELAQHRARPGAEPVLQALSLAAAAAAQGLLFRHWPQLRAPRWALALWAPIGLAWFVPALGAALLAAAACAVMHRFRLATAAALVAAWALGGFYYALAWPLSLKAMVMLGAGVLLALCAWGPLRTPAAPSNRPARGVLAGGLLSAVAVLGVANAGLWRNETLIAQGRPVLVEIVPVDPRSLLQGDYMRLAFRLPAQVPDDIGLDARRPQVVMALDERGVATPLRLAQPGEALASGELRVELAPSNGRWTLVTDAWHFREGEGARFEKARYGEFRVQADGRALLVGLRDAELKPL